MVKSNEICQPWIGKHIEAPVPTTLYVDFVRRTCAALDASDCSTAARIDASGNIEEYNATADKYDIWCQSNTLMQNYCYYSTFSELEKEGVEGKTFLEVGCGPCPIGKSADFTLFPF